jgi:hypothetical protein
MFKTGLIYILDINFEDRKFYIKLDWNSMTFKILQITHMKMQQYVKT